jgi:hypothetical protein
MCISITSKRHLTQFRMYITKNIMYLKMCITFMLLRALNVNFNVHFKCTLLCTLNVNYYGSECTWRCWHNYVKCAIKAHFIWLSMYIKCPSKVRTSSVEMCLTMCIKCTLQCALHVIDVHLI